MRYILDADGYVSICSETNITCENKTCTAYTGTVPDGYDSLIDWHTQERERLNAWKIENGNLVFDEDKYNQLKAIYEAETKANTPAEGGIVKITLPTDLANLSTSYNYFHPFNYSDNDVLTEGNKLTYGSMSVDYGDRTGATVYGVTVGEDVSYVRVTSNVRILNNSTSTLAFTTDIGRVRDGELTVFGGTSDTLQPETRHTSSVVVTQIPVQEGDFLFIYAYKGSKTADVDVVSAWGMTNATFEVTHVKGVTVINSTGGSGGTDDYESLNNLPRINGTKVTGNKTLEEYGIQPAGNYALKTDIPDVSGFVTEEDLGFTNGSLEALSSQVDVINTTVNKNIDDISTINGTLENKVDKVSGKGLSTNDFTNTYKSNVDNNTSARHTHSNKTVLDGITSANITSWNNKSDFSGSYDDLTNKPTIPINNNQLENGAGYQTETQVQTLIEENTKNYYGTCTTSASTQAKVVTCEGFKLENGAKITVKFTNAQTYNGTATLNVNNTGAKNICRVGTTTTTRYFWNTGEVVDFVYDGTNYVMEGKGLATTTYYGVTKLSSSTSSTSTSLAATPSAVKSAYDLANTANTQATTNATDISTINTTLTGKQDKLVSGTNIKTINGETLLGSGDLTIEAGSSITELTSNFNVWELETGLYWIKPNVTMTNYTTYYSDIGTAVGITESESMATFTNQLTDAFLIVRNYFEGFGLVEFEMFITNELPAKITGATMYQDGLAMGATVSGGDFVLFQKLMNKQDKLVSGTSIKTINNQSLLSSGNLTLQPTLVSGTNIKTINGTSLLGSGDITIESGSGGGNAPIELTSATNLWDLETGDYYGNGVPITYYNLNMDTGETGTALNTLLLSVRKTTDASGITNWAFVGIVSGELVYGTTVDYTSYSYGYLGVFSNTVRTDYLKTINGQSLIGTGDITISSGGGSSSSQPTVYNVTGSATSVSTATNKTIATLKIPAGTYIINAHVSFGANTTGVRKIYIGTTQDSYANTRAISDTRPASNHQTTMSNISTVLNPETETTYYLNVYQNSGSSLSCSGSLRAVRIGDYAEYQAGL